MKNISLTILALTLSTVAFAQKITTNQVPGPVGKAFRAKFPTASQDSWSKEGPTVFEVEFFSTKKRQAAKFDDTGKWLQTETEINYQQVPNAVDRAFTKQFDGYKVQEAYERDTPDGLTYELIVLKGTSNYNLVFSNKGVLLSKEEGDTKD